MRTFDRVGEHLRVVTSSSRRFATGAARCRVRDPFEPTDSRPSGLPAARTAAWHWKLPADYAAAAWRLLTAVPDGGYGEMEVVGRTAQVQSEAASDKLFRISSVNDSARMPSQNRAQIGAF